jgi:hypothetical protein
MFGALAVAGLAAGRALIGLHAMFGLIDRENRHSPAFVVADGTILIPLKGPIHQCHRGYGPEKADDQRARRKELI